MREDFIDDEDEQFLAKIKQESAAQKAIEGAAAMDLTLGDSKLNIKNDSLRNPVEATLGNSLGVQGSDPLGSLKANTLSSRKPDGASDG